MSLKNRQFILENLLRFAFPWHGITGKEPFINNSNTYDLGEEMRAMFYLNYELFVVIFSRQI